MGAGIPAVVWAFAGPVAPSVKMVTAMAPVSATLMNVLLVVLIVPFLGLVGS
jgi:hypothetical protein